MDYWLRRELDDPSANPRNAPGVLLGDPCRGAVTACIKVALAVMRSSQGFDALVQTGEDTLQAVRPGSHLSCAERTRLPGWAGSFLEQLSKGFVPVTLTNRTNREGSDMWFEPADWSKTLKTWKPNGAGTMYLSKFVCCLPSQPEPPLLISQLY